MPNFVRLSETELARLRRKAAHAQDEAYPFSQLGVGEAFYLSYEEYCARPRVTTPTLASMFSTLKKQAKKYAPHQFVVTRRDTGFLVARIS